MSFFRFLKSDDPKFKSHLFYLLSTYFFILFNYSIVKAASTTMFIEEFGAKASPLAWIWTVVFLSISIYAFNKYQTKHSVQKVLFSVSTITTLIFTVCFLGFEFGYRSLSYVSFVLKEIYIVMQIHLVLGYLNNYCKKEDFKKMVSLVGGVGSVGAILGGLITSVISKSYGTNYVALFSVFFVFLPAILFLGTKQLEKNVEEKKVSPLASLKDRNIKEYVFYIGLIVMLTQFIINIADFKFNLAFEKNILVSSDRTAYLGYVYSWTNFVTLILQFVFLPIVLPRISERSLHLFIPVSYLICTVALMMVGESYILPIAAFYIYLKGSDYSLFSAGKEFLYIPLKGDQKYGAKYLTDMLVYRVSKALIAAVLIYLHSSSILNMMMIIFLLLWVGLVIKIFGIHRKLFI